MSRKFSVHLEFKALDRVTAPIARMQTSVGAMTRSIGTQINRLNGQVNKFVGNAKRMAIAGAVVGAAALGAFTNVVGAGMDFQQAIANVGAVSLKTVDEIQPLKDLARELGRTTVFTATQSANAMEILARAGLDVNKTLAATPGILDAAAAGQMEIADTAEIVLGALKGMGLDQIGDIGEQTIRMADNLALASARTKSTMASLGEGLSKVGLVATDVGWNPEEIVSAVALLQDVGVEASISGTALKVMLGKMAKPPLEVKRAMQQMKISFEDVNGDMLNMNELLAELTKGSDNFQGSMDRLAFFVDLVGMRGQLAANALVKLYRAGRTYSLTKELEDARGKGVVKQMAKLRLDTLKGDVTILRSAIESVKISIEETVDGPLREVVQKTTEWVNANEALIGQRVGEFLLKIIKNKDAILATAKEIGRLVAAAVALIAVLKIVVAVMTIVNLVMTMNPLGLIISGIALLIIGLTALFVKYRIWGKLMGFIQKHAGWVITSWEAVKSALGSVWTVIETQARKALGKILGLVNKVKGVINDIGGFLGIGGDDAPEGVAAPGGVSPMVVSPAEQTARTISEQWNRSSAEVTIRDQTGRAEVTKGTMGPSLVLVQSGAF